MILGCGTEPETKPTQFVILIDSIAHVPSLIVGDTIAIKLFGTIGNDGCHLFSHFEDSRQALRLDLTVWGQRSPSGVCPDVMVYLNGREYKLATTQTGWFSINIHQPDGTVLRDSILVQ